MRERLTGCLMIFILILLIPCVITLMIGREITVPVSGENSGPVRLVGDGQRIDLQEYLIGVTAAQLSGDSPLEAIKAQMILNRTYYYQVLGDRGNLSAAELTLNYLSLEKRRAKWLAEGQDDAENLFLRAETETNGLVMTCQRELAAGMYHLASAGRTRDLSKDYPYLQSVDSAVDMEMDGYLTVVDYSLPVLAERLRNLGMESLTAGSLKNSLQILEKDEGGYVKSMLVGTEVYDGDLVAACLGLPSAAFSIQWPEENRVQINCRGSGHGYGLSQYGASQMAKDGKTAVEILNYYFQNISVERWNQSE